jgi:hypothetical protein
VGHQSRRFNGKRRSACGKPCSSSRSRDAVTQAFPTLAGIGLGTAYGLCTAFVVLAFFFVVKVLSETRGRELS